MKLPVYTYEIITDGEEQIFGLVDADGKRLQLCLPLQTANEFKLMFNYHPVLLHQTLLHLGRSIKRLEVLDESVSKLLKLDIQQTVAVLAELGIIVDYLEPWHTGLREEPESKGGK